VFSDKILGTAIRISYNGLCKIKFLVKWQKYPNQQQCSSWDTCGSGRNIDTEIRTGYDRLGIIKFRVDPQEYANKQ